MKLPALGVQTACGTSLSERGVHEKRYGDFHHSVSKPCQKEKPSSIRDGYSKTSFWEKKTETFLRQVSA